MQYLLKLSFIGFTLILISHTQGPPSCLNGCQQMAYYSCNICFQNCPSSLRMLTCEEEYCAHWTTDSSTDSNGNTQTNTYCDDYQKRFLNELDCIYNCCDKAQYTSFTSLTYPQCVLRNFQMKAYSNKVGIIVGSVFGAVFGLVFIIVIGCICFRIQCCSSLKQCIGNCCHFFRDQFRVESRQISVEMTYKNHTETYPPAQSNALWFPSIHDIKDTKCQRPCSICLDNGTNCETTCGHWFHYRCFEDWVNKSYKCPLCITDHFNPLKIYCQKCRQRYTQHELNRGGSMKNRFQCDRCRGNIINMSNQHLTTKL